ncbi:MAG: hypothetical protein CL677_05385 [Bdellovibrionaceae bacterium]|nr:hypothetical protein [Pseudobdellovibrionaceae bacterium]
MHFAPTDAFAQNQVFILGSRPGQTTTYKRIFTRTASTSTEVNDSSVKVIHYYDLMKAKPEYAKNSINGFPLYPGDLIFVNQYTRLLDVFLKEKLSLFAEQKVVVHFEFLGAYNFRKREQIYKRLAPLMYKARHHTNLQYYVHTPEILELFEDLFRPRQWAKIKHQFRIVPHPLELSVLHQANNNTSDEKVSRFVRLTTEEKVDQIVQNSVLKDSRVFQILSFSNSRFNVERIPVRIQLLGDDTSNLRAMNLLENLAWNSDQLNKQFHFEIYFSKHPNFNSTELYNESLYNSSFHENLEILRAEGHTVTLIDASKVGSSEHFLPYMDFLIKSYSTVGLVGERLGIPGVHRIERESEFRKFVRFLNNFEPAEKDHLGRNKAVMKRALKTARDFKNRKDLLTYDFTNRPPASGGLCRSLFQ